MASKGISAACRRLHYTPQLRQRDKKLSVTSPSSVAQRLQHMLKYCTGLQFVGFGQAFPDSSNHFAHERIVFQAHSPRNGLFKREPDIVGTNASCDRHKGLRTLLRYLANGL